MYNGRARIAVVSLSLLAHVISGNLFQIFSQLPATRNHHTLTPNHSLSLSNSPETVCIFLSTTKLHHLLPFPKHYQQHLFTMKSKSDISASETKTTSNQQNADPFVPKRIEPISTIPPTKPKKKNTSKSAAKKKKFSKKGESKVALDMTDSHIKDNLKSTKAGTFEQDAEDTKDDESFKISADVSTLDPDKGNPHETLISNVPESGRKLGLEDMNDAIDSTENMDIDIGNNVNDSVETNPDETNSQEDIGPDVETSLDQPSSNVGVTATDGKNFSFETAP